MLLQENEGCGFENIENQGWPGENKWCSHFLFILLSLRTMESSAWASHDDLSAETSGAKKVRQEGNRFVTLY